MTIVLVALAGCSLAYLVACLAVTLAWQSERARRAAVTQRAAHLAPTATAALSTAHLPGVSVLKPLCGLEPDLDRNLRSFSDQTYPAFEVLCGTRDADDPALDVVQRLAIERPSRFQALPGAPTIGANPKVNTLAHLLPHARHSIIVIADSDIRVGPTYLERLVPPFTDPTVGVVTCLYRGSPTRSLWSRLGALAIDEWFRPSVLVARAAGSSAYCFGATIALRREVLDGIGGFEALGSHLADDYELGHRVRRLGLRAVVSDYEVATTVHEPSLAAMFGHELRWMRTIRAIQPIGHACSVVTYALPLTLLAAAVVARPWALGLPAAAVLLRLLLHWVSRRDRPEWIARTTDADLATGWMVPVRDLVSFGVWAASFVSRRVTWRQQAMRLRADGILHGVEEAAV